MSKPDDNLKTQTETISIRSTTQPQDGDEDIDISPTESAPPNMADQSTESHQNDVKPNSQTQSLSLKERILLFQMMKSHSSESTDSDEQSNSSDISAGSENCSPDLKDRLRINQVKLQALLKKNPLDNQKCDVTKAEEDSDIPFQPGTLRLSVFRTSPEQQTKQYEISPKYASVFESFVKRRPLSESFATTRPLSENFAAIRDLDINSSSDEELTDPIPESPLNLSDAENMASPDSPGFMNRRRNKFVTQNNDTRPKSLYDSAKPRPPSKTKRSSKTDSVGGRLGRLMNLRPWKSSERKPSDVHKSTYERSFEPVPVSDGWSNVVGQNPDSSNSAVNRLQPHPPATSPTRPIPGPRKKRHAPKPPENVAPYALTTDVGSDVISTPDLDVGHGNENPVLGTEVATPTPEPRPSDIPSISDSSTSSFQNNPSDEQMSPADVTPTIPVADTVEPFAEVTLENSVTTPDLAVKDAVISSNLIDASLSAEVKRPTEPSGPQTKIPQKGESNLPDNITIPTVTPPPRHVKLKKLSQSSSIPPNISDNDEVQIDGGSILHKAEETTNQEHIQSLDSQPQESAFPAVVSESIEKVVHSVMQYLIEQVQDAVSSSQKNNTKSFGKESASRENLPIPQAAEIPIVPVEANMQESANVQIDASAIDTNSQSFVGDDVTLSVNHSDVIKSFDDEIHSTVSLRDSPRDEKQRKKKTRRRKSADNASSGYSSPGSGDEGPISPEPPPSVTSLPSPTSSYYSASLSASSSRVSDLSRELTLAKPVIKAEYTDNVPRDKIAKRDESPVAESADTKEQEIADHEKSKITEVETNNNGNTKIQEETPEKPTENSNHSGESSAELTTKTDIEISALAQARAYKALPDKPVQLRQNPGTRVRSKSEYIPYSEDTEEWQHEIGVSICMIEKPVETTGSLSKSQARLYKPALQKGIKAPSKKKALAAAQKSRAFAMRAKPHWQRHSYAESSTSPYILGGVNSEPTLPSSNLVSHFVSTQNISTYYDGIEQRTVTPHEILTSKREEFFNAFKNTNNRNSEHFGGSVRHLPVSSNEFVNDVIHEVSEIDSPVKAEQAKIANLEESSLTTTKETHQVQRQPSETSSTDSSTHYSSQNSSVYTGSTWSLSGDMASQARTRKPSLRRRLQGAFSFQNIRKAISMEKLSEEEKRRSMSHHYLNESGNHDLNSRPRSSTLQDKTSSANVPGEQPLRKAGSISSIISSVRMRKRRSRMRADNKNRYTIADPENFAKNMDEAPGTKRSPLRPLSMILSNTNRRKLDDVGTPSYFRPIGRVLQMNPAEGTLLVEMVKPPSGPFGFYIARKKEAGDSGSVFISRLSDSYPDKMFAGLMRTGDEITEINGTNVSGLTLDQVYDLILDSERTLLKLKPAQVHVV
ncbi:uncharacterized protein LOC120344403 isoform X2 [Styela clava]